MMAKRITLEGHGTWQLNDGVFIVPANVTILFYCNHGENVPGDGAHGEARQTKGVGASCGNYRLWPMYGGMVLACRAGARFALDPLDGRGNEFTIVNGVHAWGVELAYIVAQVVVAFPDEPIVLRWNACREIVADGSDMYVKNRVGLSVAVAGNVISDADSHPVFGNAMRTPVNMRLPGQEVVNLQPYLQWALERVNHGVLPNVDAA
jgi:hypothetical protein